MKNVCFDFLSNFETFLFLRLIQWDIIHVHNSSCKVEFILVLVKFRFSRHILEKKNRAFKYRKRPSCGSRVLPCSWVDRRTDRHDEADSRFSQFCERA